MARPTARSTSRSSGRPRTPSRREEGDDVRRVGRDADAAGGAPQQQRPCRLYEPRARQEDVVAEYKRVHDEGTKASPHFAPTRPCCTSGRRTSFAPPRRRCGASSTSRSRARGHLAQNVRAVGIEARGSRRSSLGRCPARRASATTVPTARPRRHHGVKHTLASPTGRRSSAACRVDPRAYSRRASRSSSRTTARSVRGGARAVHRRRHDVPALGARGGLRPGATRSSAARRRSS